MVSTEEAPCTLFTMHPYIQWPRFLSHWYIEVILRPWLGALFYGLQCDSALFVAVEVQYAQSNFLLLLICRVIRLTTPVLNYVIISGSLLMYLSVFCGLLPAAHKESVFRAQCFVSYDTKPQMKYITLRYFTDPSLDVRCWVFSDVWNNTN